MIRDVKTENDCYMYYSRGVLGSSANDAACDVTRRQRHIGSSRHLLGFMMCIKLVRTSEVTPIVPKCLS